MTTIQRDLIYECYKLATGNWKKKVVIQFVTVFKDTLRIHISKDFSTFEKDILSRLVRAAIVCPGFSVKQKNGVLSNAQVLKSLKRIDNLTLCFFSRIECPEDLECYLKETANFIDSSILEIIR